jgi:hypothetical protein
VVQPYAIAIDEYLMLRNEFLRSEDSKQRLSQGIFEDLVPGTYSRVPKGGAQMGNSSIRGGVRAACVDRGFDDHRMQRHFARLHSVDNSVTLDSLSGLGVTPPPYHPLKKEGGGNKSTIKGLTE